MAQDIRELFKNDDFQSTEKLNKGHQKRFESKLEKELPQATRGSFYFYRKIAVVLIVALGVGLFFWNTPGDPGNEIPLVNTLKEKDSLKEIQENGFQLSDISPEFKKIETYYLAGINLELANLGINNDNKALIDAFMLELEELDKEYQRLNAELNETGPNEQTIEAMVSNLQLRLDLLRRLKIKLNEIKKSKTNSYEDLKA
ncbi:hypothetical protein [Gillisia limnaea]|uniref:Uncharacterized protein n=1 Tax=Gillisia limnaea (strain DSM 15749 / LMG 21470 / R-8282) TaxID=865937 RepID=H2BSR2_GILLR|nr:hypothetical protein [Gillisia limnaea]EHQ03648.1 hypothetical protein Gilli_3038 [Gillisia limnaea DSM 15749]